MLNFFKKVFCGHYISTQVCKIQYLPSSTELVYTTICKDCGKKIGNSTTRQVGK